MGLSDRLSEWREMTFIETEAEDPEIIAGRQAEKFLMQLVESNLKYKGVHCFLGKRVPSRQNNRRYEIDLIVLTHKHLHFLEVKNWTGEVQILGSNWVQIRRNGEKISHPNLTKYNSYKQDVLIRFLEDRGIVLNKSYFSQKIIFMNERLVLEPSIKNDPFVIPRNRLNNYLTTQRGSSFGERFLYSIIEACLDFENSKIVIDGLFKAMPQKYVSKIKKNLASLGTWDKIGLYGQKILTGDVLKIKLGHRTINISNLPSGSKLNFSWTRNKVLGLIKALATTLPTGNLFLSGEKIAIQPNDLIKFHPAGEKKPIQFPISHIEWIIKG